MPRTNERLANDFIRTNMPERTLILFTEVAQHTVSKLPENERMRPKAYPIKPPSRRGVVNHDTDCESAEHSSLPMLAER